MLLSSIVQHRDSAGNQRNLAVLAVETQSERVYLDLVSPGSRTFLSEADWLVARAVLNEVRQDLALAAGSAAHVLTKLRDRTKPTDGPVLFMSPSYRIEPDLASWRDQIRQETLGRRRVVVFLDIDGVLATDASYVLWDATGRSKDEHPLDRTLVAALDAILVEAGADVILSTSWRYPHNFGYERTIRHLRDAGLTVPVIGHTPMPGECRYDMRKMSSRLPRGYEIFQVVEDLMLCPEDFIILDDDREAGRVPPSKPQFMSRWIKTKESTGLTKKHLERLRSMLQE